MTSSEIVRRNRHAAWESMIEERIASGLSVEAFCYEKDISVTTYYYRQKKARDTALTAITAGNVTQAAAGNWATVVRSSGEVQSVGNNTVGSLTVRIGSGAVEVNSNTDINLLAAVCKVLKSL